LSPWIKWCSTTDDEWPNDRRISVAVSSGDREHWRFWCGEHQARQPRRLGLEGPRPITLIEPRRGGSSRRTRQPMWLQFCGRCCWLVHSSRWVSWPVRLGALDWGIEGILRTVGYLALTRGSSSNATKVPWISAPTPVDLFSKGDLARHRLLRTCHCHLRSSRSTCREG